MPRRLGTRSGEACLHAKGVFHLRRNLCAPRRLAASQASLSQARPGVGEEGARNALCRLVSGAGGSGTCFFPNPGPHVSALGSQIQDPGSGSRIGTRPALGASQKAGGCTGGPSPSARAAGGLRWLLQPLGWVTMAASAGEEYTPQRPLLTVVDLCKVLIPPPRPARRGPAHTRLGTCPSAKIAGLVSAGGSWSEVRLFLSSSPHPALCVHCPLPLLAFPLSPTWDMSAFSGLYHLSTSPDTR